MKWEESEKKEELKLRRQQKNAVHSHKWTQTRVAYESNAANSMEERKQRKNEREKNYEELNKTNKMNKIHAGKYNIIKNRHWWKKRNLNKWEKIIMHKLQPVQYGAF